MRDFASVLAAWAWRAIPGCPGRWVLAGERERTPLEVAGGGEVEVLGVVAGARDPVHVVRLADGGLLSYEKPDGGFVHTLGDAPGFARKLAMLGASGAPAARRPV